VSSPTGWKTVHVKTARHESPAFDVARRKAVRELPPQPEINSGDSSRVRVERGDSLWSLAVLYLGKGARWRELAEINAQLSDPNLIRPGDWIHLPSREPPRNAKQIVVRSADTLWSVARGEYGGGSACGVLSVPILIQSIDRQHQGERWLPSPPQCPFNLLSFY
jgi:nucleoid-associated protein YgaU